MKYLLYLTLLFAGIVILLSCKESFTIAPTASSDPYAILRGRVLYSANQQPARNALVTLNPNSRVVATDSSGRFHYDSVLVGSYTIQAAKAGYVTQMATVTATSGALPAITLLLTEVKDTVVVTPTTNSPPLAATLVAPALNSIVQPASVTLKWKSTDPDKDILTYDVQLFKSGVMTAVSSYTGLKVDSLVVTNLDYNTSYFWQVTVKDATHTTNGPVWPFSTIPFPNYSYVFARLLNGQYQIFASNATGAVLQLTRTGSNWRPIVSPNRQQIAFISSINDGLYLHVMNADGSNIRQVTSVPIAGLYPTDLSFCWSPDGTQLLFPSYDKLFAVQTDGNALRTLIQATPGRIFAGCDWSQQGNRIAARTTGTSVYDNEISTYNTDGSGAKSVFVRKTKRVGNPVFSITGNLLVFSADSSSFMNEQGRQLDARILMLDLVTNAFFDLSSVQNGSQTQIDKPAGTNDLDPRFSPNGLQVIFTNTDNTGIGTRSVYTIDLAGSGTSQSSRNRKLLFTPAEMPYWRQP
ncbi:carboxypeptidase regulatory-like domain-containing protein [Spirosoma areae]